MNRLVLVSALVTSVAFAAPGIVMRDVAIDDAVTQAATPNERLAAKLLRDVLKVTALSCAPTFGGDAVNVGACALGSASNWRRFYQLAPDNITLLGLLPLDVGQQNALRALKPEIDRAASERGLFKHVHAWAELEVGNETKGRTEYHQLIDTFLDDDGPDLAGAPPYFILRKLLDPHLTDADKADLDARLERLRQRNEAALAAQRSRTQPPPSIVPAVAAPPDCGGLAAVTATNQFSPLLWAGLLRQIYVSGALKELPYAVTGPRTSVDGWTLSRTNNASFSCLRWRERSTEPRFETMRATVNGSVTADDLRETFGRFVPSGDGKLVQSYPKVVDTRIVMLTLEVDAAQQITALELTSTPAPPTPFNPLPLALPLMVLCVLLLVGGAIVLLVRKGKLGSALGLGSLLFALPALGLQAVALWLNLSMLPEGIKPGAREGLALLFIYAADAAWLLGLVSFYGLTLALTIARPTRFRFAWWTMLLASVASTLVLLNVIPGRV